MCNKLVINSQVKPENGCFNYYSKSKIIKNSQKNTRGRKFQEVEVGDQESSHNREKLAVLYRHPHHTQVQKPLREESSCLCPLLPPASEENDWEVCWVGTCFPDVPAWALILAHQNWSISKERSGSSQGNELGNWGPLEESVWSQLEPISGWASFLGKGEGSTTRSVRQGHREHTGTNLSSRMFVTRSPTVPSLKARPQHAMLLWCRWQFEKRKT